MNKNQDVASKLTEEQKKKIKPAVGRDAEAVELNVEELEERISPMKLS